MKQDREAETIVIVVIVTLIVVDVGSATVIRVANVQTVTRSWQKPLRNTCQFLYYRSINFG